MLILLDFHMILIMLWILWNSFRIYLNFIGFHGEIFTQFIRNLSDIIHIAHTLGFHSIA